MPAGITPIAYPSFGRGLNLRDEPDVIAPDEAMDCLNVEFTERGAVKQRSGYTKFTTAAATADYDSLAAFYTTAGTRHLVAGAGNELRALNTSGALVASGSVATTANPHFFTRFGGPGAEVLLAANGTDSVRQWNGSAWSTPAWTGTAPTGRFLAVDANSNRIVNARRTGTTNGDSPSTVRFSDATTGGLPLNWGANNFVELTPGDGEPIMGLVAWRDYVIVFKESKFFVFYGESTDSTGNPVFEYRPVDAGIGLASSRALVATRDGVYFLGRHGVYRTTGAEPVLVSEKLEGLFQATSPPFYSGSPINFAQITKAALTWHDERIYLAVPTAASATNNRLFVFDPRYDWWTVHDIPAGDLEPFRVGDNPDLMFAYATGTNDIGRALASATDDAGTAILSFWRGGWWDHDQPYVHVVREHKLWGTGTVTSALATDFKSASSGAAVVLTVSSDTWNDDAWDNDTWGGGASLLGRLTRVATRGAVFSLQFTNSAGTAWEVHRATMHLRESWVPQAPTG